MQDYYLDSQYESQKKHGYFLGTAAALYGWNLLDLGDKFLNTGKWSVPGLAWAGATRDLVKSGDVVRRASSPLGDAIGLKFRGATATGMLNMGLARTVGAANLGATLSSPGYYAARLLFAAAEAGPAAPGVLLAGATAGIAWFGARAMIGNTAAAMKRNQYVNMGSSFVDNGATYSSRQRAVRAIAESHLQARSAIGNEAQLFHHSGG